MKNLDFKLGGAETLTREQMKKIVGGQAACYVSNSCGSNYFVSCLNLSADQCQQVADSVCDKDNECCDNVDCRDMINMM